MARARLLSAGVLAAAFFACAYDNAYRQDYVAPRPPICTLGATRCDGDTLQTCEIGVDQRAGWAPKDDCGAKGLACASPELGCKPCQPGAKICGDTLKDRVDTCRADGSGYDPGDKCTGAGKACRGGICDDLCAVARVKQSNIGCEYWAVDLDNANISASLNASAQQYAVVVSNPQLDVAANVVVEQDDGDPGTAPAIRVVGKARVTPQNLEVFLLGPREVDGDDPDPTSPQSLRTNSALTRRAFRITSDVPIIAYQFNPLDNANVFSNDASLLKPVEAVGGASRYVVVGWPQTIAEDDSPDHNFGLHLRNFVTIVGTRAATGVTIKTTADIVAGGAVKGTKQGDTLTFHLEPFEVLNLESGAFGADFTGSIIDASGPVIVFSGSEASDAPHWNAIAERSCCADHLEEQLDPARTAGRRFVVGHSPNRSRAVFASGATAIGPFDEPEYARFVAVAEGPVHVRTSLPGPDGDFYVTGPGGFREIVYHEDFSIETDGAVHVSEVQVSQEGAGIPRGYPGGDPSLLIVPPIEQFRPDYVFLTPDKYAFDFFTVLAPKDTLLLLDGAPPDADACEKVFVAPAKSPVTGTVLSAGYDVWKCQLSFPIFDPLATSGTQLKPGRQNDGVHRLQANRPVGLIAYGFDSFVSYAYAAGTQLESLTPR
jgi:hypothetical protein